MYPRTTYLVLLCSLAAMLLFALTPPALAGTLTHFSCQVPDGHPTYVSSGWTTRESGAAHASVVCDGRGIGIGFSASAQHGNADLAEAKYSAPADTRIVELSAYRRTAGISHTNTGGSPSADLNHYDLFADSQRIDTCSPFAQSPSGGSQCPSGKDGVFNRASLDASQVTAVVGCGFEAHHVCLQDGSGVSAQVRVPWATFVLHDAISPHVLQVTGSLAAPGSHHGTESVSFNVADRGTGVYRGLVEIDGKPVYEQVVDANVVGGRARCKDARPGDADPYQFIDPVPCKMSVSATVAFDTRTVTDGVHELRVVAEDASGNRTTVLGPQKFAVDNVPSADDPACRNGIDDDLDGVVDGADAGCSGGEDVDEAPLPSVPTVVNPPAPSAQPAVGLPAASTADAGAGQPTRGAPNGDRPSDDARLTAGFGSHGGSILTTSFGTRAVVRGKLVDGRGAPIGNARVELLSRNASPGSPLVDKGGARTRADGTWTMIMPKDASSRTLSFRYRSHLGDSKPAAEVALTLRVRAAVGLTVTPRVASSRGGIVISGRLLGAPLPARGKLVELQARGKGGGRWITFRTVRSDGQGRYRVRYQFRNTVGPVTYVFRARAREEAAYPFLTGVSRVVAVRVR